MRWERLMGASKYEYQSAVARKWFGAGWAEGWAEARAEAKAEAKKEGKAEMLLKMLQRKGFVLTEADRERVLWCTEESRLEMWAERVLFADCLDDVFFDLPGA